MEKITPKSVLAELRKFSGTDDEPKLLWITPHTEELWLASPFFMVKPNPITRVVLDELWDECNLAYAAMTFTAGLAIRGWANRKVPDIDKLFPDFFDLSPIEPSPLPGIAALLYRGPGGVPVEMWRREDGVWSTVNADFADFVRRHSDACAWRQGATDKAIVGIDKYGEACALLAPLNAADNDALVRDPDLPQRLFDF